MTIRLNLSLVCLLTFLVSGCQSPGVLVKRSQMHMGTVVFITAVAEKKEIAEKAVSTGFQEIRELEEMLSAWIPTSELSRVNQAAGQEPMPVSHETMDLLVESLKIAELTKGGFNIAIGPAVKAWNVTDAQRIPSDEELKSLQPLVDLENVRLDATKDTVYLARSGMELDIGGIGKGYAADLAVERMKAVGATAGVVALSGDIKTFGRMPDGEKFLFGIQHPRKEQGHVLAKLELENEAVSTAGDYQRFFMHEGIRYHHILDPRNLKPSHLCQSVTVIAAEGVMADGLDTGIFVMGPESGMALVKRLPGVEAIIIDEEGRVLVSSGLKGRLQLVDASQDESVKTSLP